jgi:hypothetical protein
MRHILLGGLVPQIFGTREGEKNKRRLIKGHKRVAQLASADRQKYIRENGSTKWSPIKKQLTNALGHKCWYTEAELVGAPLTIDHFRPVCDYWWLAFDPENYRIACPYSNSPEHNKEHGCAGGKGDNFPLLAPGIRATGKNKLRLEKPVILDPCRKEDCDLLAFQVDGRPILNPIHALDPIALRRVEESMLLLNLDHPDFNSKREQLCHDIAQDVNTYESLNPRAAARAAILSQMRKRLSTNAAFSTAARYYLQLHRDLSWVEQLLNE